MDPSNPLRNGQTFLQLANRGAGPLSQGKVLHYICMIAPVARRGHDERQYILD